MVVILSPIKITNVATAGSLNIGTINLTWNTSNMKMQGGSGSFNVGDLFVASNPLNNNTPIQFDNDLFDINRII